MANLIFGVFELPDRVIEEKAVLPDRVIMGRQSACGEAIDQRKSSVNG
jgi:hypothetical protein